MQFIKNITSKDINLSINTIKNLISTCDVENFKLLAQKADFIFPFLKNRIIKDFVKLVNKENLTTVIEFTKVYSFDFEEMIVQSLLKFASEDLTDEILELFEKGTKEQKAYCACYFSHIKDTLALDLLYENYKSDFEPLRTNCIQALKAFKDKELVKIAKENILSCKDEAEKLDDYEVLSIFNEVKFIVENTFNSVYISNIISDLMNYNDLESLKNKLNNFELERIIDVIIESYPEDISLDTVLYYQILEYLKLISKFEDEYSKAILLLAKAKFKEFFENDIYSFDFDKTVKEEIKKIFEFLKSLELDFEFDIEKIKNDKKFFNLLLNVFQEYKIEKYDEILANFINKSEVENEFVARIAEILSINKKTNLIDKNVIENLENQNLKALVLSYLN